MTTPGIQFGRIIAGELHAPVVYFIAMTYGGRPAVKIGTSTRLKTRIRSVSYAAELTDVLLLVPGGEDVETALHDRFREYQIPPFAELFWLEGRLRDFVAQPAFPQLPLRVRLRRRWWSRSIERAAAEPESAPEPPPAEPEPLPLPPAPAPEPEPSPEPKPEPDPDAPDLVSLRQAVAEEVIKVGGRDPLAAARKAAQRPGFPAIAHWDGKTALYSRTELREWQDGKVRVLR
jgi:hypothetical protein